MKLSLKILLYILLVNSCFAQETSTKKAQIIFKESMHNFKTIKYKKEVSYLFEFKNVGKIPVNIEKVETSCHCTVAEKPDKPIKPKEKANIRVAYEANEEGKFQKSIKIYSNAENSPAIVYIKGFVIK